ncbi:hypothetical protein CHIBA101_0712 [Actinomyces sp. Chiba101]|uniref:hypothetical protein n=1 Tax=Actinomyces denticolens TaxID=52767 RepID=UPI000974E15D|nr:hypothetical protein [Actinomyces denticolens]BAW92578.1 hypothetical protein CHIBA101_0712 [Actinomyces sp. Chiba101]GAV94464.1 hypothetical protein ADENT20671_1233 [Actinomyces denticolens]
MSLLPRRVVAGGGWSGAPVASSGASPAVCRRQPPLASEPSVLSPSQIYPSPGWTVERRAAGASEGALVESGPPVSTAVAAMVADGVEVVLMVPPSDEQAPRASSREHPSPAPRIIVSRRGRRGACCWEEARAALLGAGGRGFMGHAFQENR